MNTRDSKVKLALLAAIVFAAISARATDQYFAGDSSALVDSKWGPAGGPYTSPFTPGNVAVFAVPSGLSFGAGGITVAGLTALENFSLNSASGTMLTGGTVVPVNVASGKVLDLGSLAISSAVGVGLIKNGDGAFATAGGLYPGGFTLNAGYIIASSVNAMGAGPANTLTINGGGIGGTKTNDFTDKFGGGIVIGGNFQLGVLPSAIGMTINTGGNMTFNNTISLGTATRTITIGANGAYTLGGIISGDPGVGLTVDALTGASGYLVLSGGNTYTGTTTINGGTVKMDQIGATPADGIVINSDGALGGLAYANLPAWLASGKITTSSSGTLAITAAHTDPVDFAGYANLRLGTIGSNTFSGTYTPGTAGVYRFGGNGSGTLTYSSIINNSVAGTIVDKTGKGALTLSGNNSYGGGTDLYGGFLGIGHDNALGTGPLRVQGDATLLRVTTDRTITNAIDIATTKTLSVYAGTTSSTKLTLNGPITLNGTSTLDYYTAGKLQLGGVLAGSGTVKKTGSGILTMSGANTYTGNTTVSVGSLVLDTTGKLRFVIGATSGNANALAGAGTATINGKFEIDTALADASALTSGSWQLVSLGATPVYGGSFGVISGATTWASSGGKFTKSSGGKNYEYDTATGILVLSLPGGSTFSTWMSGYTFAPGADTTATGDADNDGIANVVENVLGTAPNAPTTGLTQVSATGSSVTFQHPLNPDIASNVDYTYEWSTDLIEWKATGVSNTGGKVAVISPVGPVAGVMTVTTSLTPPHTSSTLFVRIVANQTTP